MGGQKVKRTSGKQTSDPKNNAPNRATEKKQSNHRNGLISFAVGVVALAVWVYTQDQTPQPLRHGTPGEKASRGLQWRHAAVKVVGEYPHSPFDFTEGFFFHPTGDGSTLLESTGMHNETWIQEVEWLTATPVRKRVFEEEVFGEGLTWYDDKLYFLTYKDEIGYVLDFNTLDTIDTFRYSGEGWGLTTDYERDLLIRSNGSAILFYMDPTTLQTTREVTVTANGDPLRGINELEYVNGLIYANVFPTTVIAVILPDSGEVLAVLDFMPELRKRINEEMMNQLPKNLDVWNGIAYHPTRKTLFVTGKYFPFTLEVETPYHSIEEALQASEL